MNRPLVALALAIGSLAAVSTPAMAQFYFGFGPRYWAPSPYYYPPPAYYPPAAPGYYPPPGPGYNPPGEPVPPGAPAPSAAPTPTAAGAAPGITYTNRPEFTNAAGQPCREYQTTVAGSATPVYGTACRDAGGQWRIAN